MKHKKPANSFAKKSKYKDGIQICNRECKTSLIAKLLTPKQEPEQASKSSDQVLIERIGGNDHV